MVCIVSINYQSVILVDFPIHIDTVSMGLPIVYFKDSRVYCSRLYDVFLSLKGMLLSKALSCMKCFLYKQNGYFIKERDKVDYIFL